MATVATSPTPLRRTPLASLLSLIVPGAGQIYLGQTLLGLGILVTTLFLAFLVNWALDYRKIGLVTLGGFTTSSLWLLILAFWAWNVLNATGLANNRRKFTLLGLFIAGAVMYVIAWQVTNIDLTRLVTRFSDARQVASNLVQPDLFTRDPATGAIAPSDNFGDLIGRVDLQAPPRLLVQLGLARADQDITWFTPGTIFTTIALGLVATFLSIFLAMPLSFLAAHNIVGALRFPWSAAMEGLASLFGGIAVFVWVLGGAAALPGIIPILLGLVAAIVVIVLLSRVLGVLDERLEGAALTGLRAIVGGAVVSLFFYILVAAICSWLGGVLTITAVAGYQSVLPVLALLPVLAALAGAGLGLALGLRLGNRLVLFGEPIYIVARAIFNIMRSIDTLIWGLVVIVWVGQGAMAGVMALAIHSVAALAKLYSEEIEHIDPGPVEATAASGGNLLQQIRYAVVPQIIPPFLAYTLLRWDINMRAATVVGFVAGGGIGYFVVETIRKGGYAQYAAALWVVAVVIIAVDYISAKWREQILVGDTQVSLQPPRPFLSSGRNILYLVFGVVLFYLTWNLAGMDLRLLLDPGPTLGRMIRDFITFDLKSEVVSAVVNKLLETTFQALLATTLGGLIAVPFSFLAARNLTGKSPLSIWIYYIVRFVLNVLRSIEALLYVAIFVFWVGIGAFAGMMALAVTTFALIGKLFSEAIEDIDPGPVEAINATGANRLQTIMFGILPQIIPPFVSYSIYQWDINIRIATIIGFAGGGGIGLLFLEYAGLLQYHKAGTVILLIVAVVTAMDFASAKIRERMV